MKNSRTKRTQPINLRDRQEVMALLKQLYGNDEVKDDQTISNTRGTSRTKGVSEVVERTPNT